MKAKKTTSQDPGGSRAVNSLLWLLFAAVILLAMLGVGLFFSGNSLFFRNRHFTFRILDLQEDGPGYWGRRPLAIAARAGIHPGKDNLWQIDPGIVRSRLMNIPAIASCEVRRVLPDTLQILISERIPCAAIENPVSPRLLADDCIVLSRSEALTPAGELPVIAGFGLRHIPTPGSRCPAADEAMKLLRECLRNYPDISIQYINIRNPKRLDCVLRYRNRRSYRAWLPTGQRYDYLLAALQSSIIDVLKRHDKRTMFDLMYRGQVVIR